MFGAHYLAIAAYCSLQGHTGYSQRILCSILVFIFLFELEQNDNYARIDISTDKKTRVFEIL